MYVTSIKHETHQQHNNTNANIYTTDIRLFEHPDYARAIHYTYICYYIHIHDNYMALMHSLATNTYIDRIVHRSLYAVGKVVFEEARGNALRPDGRSHMQIFDCTSIEEIKSSSFESCNS